MIYFVTALEDNSPFGRLGRRYGRALIEDSQDVRFLPLTRSLSLATPDLDPEDRIIAQRFGGGPGEVEACIYHGTPKELTKRAFEEDPGQLSIALTLTMGNLSDKELVGLKRYREVWVPCKAEMAALKAKGLRRVRVVYPPTFEDDLVPPSKIAVTVLYAFGMWSMVEPIFKDYISGPFADPVLLHLACPDAPFVTAEELERHTGKKAAELPPVSIQTQPLEQYSSQELKELHAAGQFYISRIEDYDCWALGACMAGNIVAGEQGLRSALENRVVRPMRSSSPAKSSGAGVMDWVSMTPDELKMPTQEVDSQVKAMRRGIERLVGKVEVITRERKVGVVIPHKDRGRTALEAVIEPILPQLTPYDVLVISDQGSSKDTLADLVDLAVVKGLTLVTSEPPECGWSLAKARNAGARAAEDLLSFGSSSPNTALLFLDADMLLPPKAIDQLEGALRNNEIATMMVLDGDRTYLPGEVNNVSRTWFGMTTGRPATGCPMVRFEDFHRVGAYDEFFEGWGSEDIDLLNRIHSSFLLRTVVAYHQPHEASPYKASHGELNRRTVQDMGTIPRELPEDWGTHTVIVMQGVEL